MSMGQFDGMLFGAELLFVPFALGVALIVTGDTMRRLIGLQFVAALGAIELVLLSIAFATESFADLGIAVALLSIGATLTYAHFTERWL